MPDQAVAVAAAFEPDGRVVGLDCLIETHRYRPDVETTSKYRQIRTSIVAVGLVEPPVIRPEPGGGGRYFLLDGHLRVRILRALGQTETLCLVAKDDEAFTYNKRVSRLTSAQEHRMIARALARGVPETLLAEALGFEPKTVLRRARILEGIDAVAVKALDVSDCPLGVYDVLRKMTPQRQREAADLMVAQDCITLAFAQALLAATEPDDVLPPARARRAAVTRDHVVKLQTELASLERQMRALDDHFGADALHFTLARGYVRRLLGDPAIEAWLSRCRPEYLDEFRAIASEA